MSEGYFSVAQAAGKIGVDFTVVIAAIRDNRLHARKRDGHYHITENDLMAFVHSYFAPKQTRP